MAVEILLPRLGWDMTEGTFGEWLKEDGATVEPGDPLFTVEGDKATQEVESMDGGVLRIRPDGPMGGEVIAVGTLLAYIAQPDETVAFDNIAADASTITQVGQERAPAHHERSQPISPDRKADVSRPRNSSPRARRVAAELKIDWTQLSGSGRSGRVIERDVRAAAALRAEAVAGVRATPVAARMAAEADVDLTELASAKKGQRVQRQDVEMAIAARAASDLAPDLAGQEERIAVTHVRRLIAQRMSHSSQTAAAVTLTTEADATELVALRQQLKAQFEPRGIISPSFSDLFIKLSVVALEENKLLNAVWHEEEILLPKSIHMGLAVDTEQGLLVPVVKDAQNKGLRRIAAETQRMIEQAQNQTLRPEDLQGATFTLTNLGMYNIDAFTPIINLPQCALLGIGRIVEKPAVYEGQVVPRQRVTLSLTFDHRVIDGGPAARGLDTIRKLVESPYPWLV